MLRSSALAAALLAAASLASAQSLGEVARRAQKRRAEMEGAAKPPKVFTDADLTSGPEIEPEEAAEGGQGSSESPEVQGSTPKAEGADGAHAVRSSSAPQKDEGPTVFGKTESYWREKRRRYAGAVESARRGVASAEKPGGG